MASNQTRLYPSLISQNRVKVKNKLYSVVGLPWDEYNDLVAKEKMTEEQCNLCLNIRYVNLMGQCNKNQCSTTFWPERS